MLKLIVFSFLLLFYKSGAQIIQSGLCDENLAVQSNFNLEQFSGTWYEFAKSTDKLPQGDCGQIEINDGRFSSTAVKANFYQESSGTATLETGTAKFTLNLTDSNNTIPFWIIQTNNVGFGVAYSCENIGTNQSSISVWALSRTQAPTQLTQILIQSALASNLNISIAELNLVDQSDQACYALPIIQPGQPIVLPGQCDPNIAVVQNFNASRFLGNWYEIAAYYSESAVGTCGRAEYSDGGDRVIVVNSEVVNQTLETITGYAVVISTDGSARLNVTLEVQPGVFLNQELLVLASDYENYAVSYSCVNLTNNEKRVFSWIVGRAKELTTEVQTAVDQVVSSVIDLNYAYFQPGNQSDAACFYFPEPSPNTSVVFRGQCDLTIPAVPLFDPVAYMRLWHDIESYPSGFQEGTCNNAFYTLVDGVVDVFNTQVINQTLDTIRGTAVLDSDDQSAKLHVSFPIAGTNEFTNTPYWVLATDYESYSLVYSCSYINVTDTRLVFAWKLSRTKELTAAANATMNEVISNIDVIDQRYFIRRDQSPEGCFYIPEPQPGVPVVFPGQCNTTIPVANNFNLTQFGNGTWYEIQAYPKEFQPGQCVRHDFTSVSATSSNLQSNAIVDQFLQVSNSSINGTDARLTITINTGNGTETIPFWILDTDYNDYALAYSCVNRGNDFKAIYSWKLSRLQQLSTAANTTINNFIASTNIDVLDNAYYEDVGQTDDDCFFLPELAPGEPVILNGQCDSTISVVQNFNASRYLGLWHLIETYPSAFQNGDCNDATYTIQSNGSVLVFNTQVINETLDTITGQAVVASTDGSAKLLVTFPDAPAPLEYWVLATDYESYSFVYSCSNLTNNQRQVWSWKLSRTRSLSSNASAIMDEIIDNVQVLNNRYYEVVNNSDSACFYYPEPNGQPVLFRGVCDESIPVVTGFDAEAYLNLWYDIESYPQSFQDGTCPTATYTLIPEGVNVFNTQVINQTLDTITGLAVLVPSNDTSAKLNVTFPNVGPNNLTVRSPYWVLATDYTNYALVYACQNIPVTNDYSLRSVSSWKLSRQKTLSAAANTAINNVINTVPVLRQTYYEVQGHTDDDCFYFPEPQPGVPVVFPGQCNTSIPVVNNFNLTQFGNGTWYEIQTYPKEFQPGQCVRHDFASVSATSSNLQSNAVVDQFLQVSNSTVNGTDARLTITINTGNGTETIPFWILATDYNDYALAYSCVNQPNDFRAIYSWKLSRTQQLSTAANTSINNFIASSNIEVLDNVYYEDVSHTDDDCFFLPELAPGEPVILNGQCDSTISVVQNFNASRYIGLWHLIETYPSAFQNGDCNDATYTIQSNGSVLVFNTQVINETLDTITGQAVVASTDGSAKLLVTFPDAPAPLEYWVLATDYESYSFVYSCSNLTNNQRQVWSWKLSRTRSLSSNASAIMDEIIDNVQVLNNRYYEVVNNSDSACFYYPEANGQPVLFRGVCDESIPVVTGFDAEAYLNLWYDIESYPQSFQDGTCPTATYTLIPEGVNVFNTQVINQTLDTITGLAVLVPSNDTSAKLNVTFPNVGPNNLTVNSPYWVLATDYTNYALVYACQNIPVTNDYSLRSVSSWKLSRQKTLSAAANTAINNVINTVPVLRQTYYEVRGHTDDDCFYFPEPQPGVPVVFPGQCNTSIPVVNNFNLTQFGNGTWYEIQTYPKDFQPGQCVRHEFTSVSASSSNLQSNAVVDQFLQISNSSVNGTDARLSITINTGNGTETIPFWILATDYNDYALAYSCVNQPNDFRAIYSWKLSRTTQLSAQAESAINTTIANIDVLDQIYYEPVNQSYDACFYYPELGPNEPVTFRGQCQNIPVVQNFSANQFSGRWFDIESYFDNYQGDCIDGYFNLTGNGYDVRLTQVVNQTLDVTNSQAVIASDNSGRLIVTVNGVQYEYWVLATDYYNYALIYSCQNIDVDRKRVRSWKMSRTRALTDAFNNAIQAVINNTNVLDARYFNVRNHSSAACFYYPDPVLGQPVNFRGRCDDTIPVVQNFSAGDYLGTWYDIESYPTSFQGGTCATAYYSLGDGVVDVYNTQVIAQRLDTINGTAVVVSNDTSAKLEVTFPVAGTNRTTVTPYWVLATDYESYSLVYSCSEIDAEYMRITSWKLSRNRTLSTQANTAINSVMATVPVLRQQYFEETGHTESDCFFYPPLTDGKVILDGQCPSPSEINTVANFSTNAFSGPWYEVSRFPSDLQSGSCANKELSANGNTFTSTIVVNERLLNVSGPAITTSGVISANLTGENGVPVPLDLYVLATDYSEYALLYSCVNVNNVSKQIYSWQLSKSRAGLSQAAINTIDGIVAENDDLFEDYYKPMDQSDYGCFYYPEYDQLPEQITLPGPCNETIVAKANFNATGYIGRWFEIARYPEPEQRGACSRAEYNFGNNGVVNVFNSQVVNRTLETQLGTAVVDSEDGSGRLLVTFVVNGETRTANYYVLDTDYTSYSLVYSCRNIENNTRRRVSSWKLSRNRTLSDAVNSTMNSIINNTQGLLQDYYTETDQSNDACFYVPELNVNEPVLFRGQCGDIRGMANFNITQYLGWWNEIESYPTGQNRTCATSVFSESGNTIQVVDTIVNGLVGQSSTYNVTATADGVLTRTSANGTQETWIVVATDYTTYSLVYTCKNINDGTYANEFRQVWSAKYSRTRQLTEQANTEIGSAIEQNDLLYQHLYVGIEQNDQACFFYPTPDGTPVVLQGQCDNNIPVQTNFQAAEYTGRWYQIERYPQLWETGNCTGAQYTLNENNDNVDVDVLNWQVIDGELDTIEGTATIIANADNGGRFRVVLPSRAPGATENDTVSFDLYVLTTDYNSYSLVYSCVNVNDFQRQVAAWKLSRERTLPASAVTQINNYMAGRRELDQRFFETVGQDDDCEEPNSSYLIKSSLIIVLACSILQLLL